MGHAHDRALQGGAAVVVGGVGGHVGRQLRHLDRLGHAAPEARPQHLALGGLEAVGQAGDGPVVVRHVEVLELALVAQLGRVAHAGAGRHAQDLQDGEALMVGSRLSTWSGHCRGQHRFE